MTAAFSAATKNLVTERADNRCERCGLPVFGGRNFHHRRARGIGSTVRSESSSPANCLLLHPSCHEYIESHRAESHAKGWLVHQWEDPRLVPVLVKGALLLLREDGTMQSASAVT